MYDFYYIYDLFFYQIVCRGQTRQLRNLVFVTSGLSFGISGQHAPNNEI